MSGRPRRIRSGDYHDYFIRDGEFIGEFEQMYQNVADPWACSSLSHRADNDLLLALIARLSGDVRSVLDLGCGLGALTQRLAETLPAAEIIGCDVSATAIAKAQQAFPGCRFVTLDATDEREMQRFPEQSLDLILMSQLSWCVLTSLDGILRRAWRMLRPGKHLLVVQAFYDRTEQKYGLGVLETTGEFKRIAHGAGFQLRMEIHIDPRPVPERPLNSIFWLTRPA